MSGDAAGGRFELGGDSAARAWRSEGPKMQAEIDRLRAALEDFANVQHWAVSRRFATPEHVWIGTVEKHPSRVAREALDA